MAEADAHFHRTDFRDALEIGIPLRRDVVAVRLHQHFVGGIFAAGQIGESEIALPVARVGITVVASLIADAVEFFQDFLAVFGKRALNADKNGIVGERVRRGKDGPVRKRFGNKGEYHQDTEDPCNSFFHNDSFRFCPFSGFRPRKGATLFFLNPS